MKILHVVTSLEVGGAENHLRILAEGQAKKGHNVSICYLSGRCIQQVRGVEIINNSMGWLPTRYFRLRKIIKEELPKIVHSHLPLAEISVALLPKSTFYKKVLTRHVTGNYSQRFTRNLFKFVSLFSMKRHDAIIAISEAVKQSLISIEGFRGLISVVHYGYEFQVKSNCLDDKNLEVIDSQTPTFVSFARLTHQKRLDIPIRASAILRSSGSNFKYYIFGEGPLEEELKSLVSKLELSNQIIISPKTSEVEGIMRRAVALVVSSQYEGFGMVYLEAINANLPIISSKNHAGMEILGSDYSFLYETENEVKLSKQMQQIIDESIAGIESLDKSKYEQLRERFALEKMLHKTEFLYQNLVNAT